MAPSDPRRPPPYQDRSQRIRALPDVAPESAPDHAALEVDLRSKGFLKVFRGLPVWGQVMVLSSVGLGASAGAVVGGVAKVLGVQTTAAAAVDKAELKLDIQGLKQGQQASDAVDAKNHADVTARVDAIQKSLTTTNARLAAIARQLGQKRAPRPAAPKEEETP